MLQYGQKRPNPLTEVAQPGIFEVVTRLNGPLSDYHPQMILQCLLWGKKILFYISSIAELKACRQNGPRQNDN